MQSFHLTLLTSSYRNFSSESDVTMILNTEDVAASGVVFLLEHQSENIITRSWADMQWYRDQNSTSGTARAEIYRVLRLIYH